VFIELLVIIHFFWFRANLGKNLGKNTDKFLLFIPINNLQNRMTKNMTLYL